MIFPVMFTMHVFFSSRLYYDMRASYRLGPVPQCRGEVHITRQPPSTGHREAPDERGRRLTFFVRYYDSRGHEQKFYSTGRLSVFCVIGMFVAPADRVGNPKWCLAV
jgi:hypothetical protein